MATTDPPTKSSAWGILVLLFFGAVGFYVADWGFLGSEISTYPLSCEAAVIDGKCPSGWKQGVHVVYSVQVKEQMVVSQADGQPPKRLDKCAVIDRTNWKCSDGPLSSVIGFTDGEFWMGYEDKGVVVPYKMPGDVKFASRWEWLTTKEKR